MNRVISSIIFVSTFLFACEPVIRTDIVRECDEKDVEQRNAVVKCVVDCSAAANPKSDEEGEDLVAQCDVTCKSMICPLKTITIRCDSDHCARISK